MPIAFFDLDRTLLSVNSGQLWVQFERREGRLRLGQALRAAAWIGAYHMGFGRIESVLEEAIESLKGQEEKEVRERTLRFYAAEVAQSFRPGAHRALAAHRAAGDTLALLTSSSVYLSEAVQQSVDIPYICCNRFETHEGRFTGKPQGSLCFGPGKLHHAQALAKQLGESLENAIFYTDSASDVPVMEVVGRAVAVHPDPALARIARRKGWEIADWNS
jgi:HAD superfamily hydrolase (TIGR01490 family)